MKLLLVDIGSLYRAVHRKWKGRRIDYQKVHRMVGHDAALALGSQVNNEAGNFRKVLEKIGYVVDYARVQNIDASAAVRVTVKAMQFVGIGDTLILASNDPLLVDLIRELHKSLIPVHLIACDPCDALLNAAANYHLLEEEHLLPEPDSAKRFPKNVEEQMDGTPEKSE